MKNNRLLLALISAASFLGSASANQPPVAEMQVVEGYRGFSVSFSLAAYDPEGDPLKFAILGPPSHGRLLGQPPDLVYVPDPGFVGADQITYLVEDPFGAFDLGIVRIQIREPNVLIRWIALQKGLVDSGRPEDAQFSDIVSALQGTLAGQGIAVWYVGKKLMGVYAPGAQIPVLLATQGDLTVTWVALTRLGEVGASLSSVPYELQAAGGGHVVVLDTTGLAPGLYLVTVGTGAVVYSLPVRLQSASTGS